jgi:signal transduction histidine kinase
VIGGLPDRFTPARWMRPPRPTARLRLTVVYGALFLISGAVLLAVAYVIAAHVISITVPGNKPEPASTTIATRTGLVRTRSGSSHVVHLTPAQAADLQAQAIRQHDRALHQLLLGSGLTLAGMTVLSLALGWLVAGRVLQPVRRINVAARRIGASNLHERLSLDGPDDEFHELAATLDDLLERLQASFDSQRRFVANASHELRTPLTLDRALLERALGKPDPTQALWRSTCERLLASSKQQDRLIDALLTLARSEAAVEPHDHVDLRPLVDSVLRGPQLDSATSELHIHTYLDTAPVTGDPRLLERLVRNLVDNAIRHNIPDGDVEIATKVHHGRALLIVTNSGPLIPVSDVERLLQPFQRAGSNRTSHGDGLGLGLSIIHAITTAHSADLTLNPQPTGGLRIEVSFPATAAPNGRPA